MKSRTEKPPSESALVLGAIVLLLVIGGGISTYLQERTVDRLSHWYDTRVLFQRILIEIVAQETALEGYSATGDPIFLRQYRSATKNLAPSLARYQAQVADDREIAEQFARVQALYRRWNMEVAAPLHAAPKGPRVRYEEVRGAALLAQIGQGAARLRSQTQARIDASKLRLARLSVGLAIGRIVVVLIFGVIWIRFERRRRERETAFAREIAERNAALERSNAQLEDFAYIASHDLQEPLRTVASFTQLLQQRYAGKLDAEADEIIGFAVDGAQRMRRLMNEILEYSRITTQGRRLVPVSLRGAVDRALENVRASIEERGAEIRIAPLPVVMGDSVQLTQLFQNLVGNAIKYNRSERPTVDIGARFDAQDGLWTIAVADNGIGIDPRYHERIFGIFTRLHTRAEYSGTGIGLALCRRIVERHGGRIWVDSVEGSGATFSFTLEPGNREVG